MDAFGQLFDISGLSLDRLRSFLLVVEAGGPTKAAKGDNTKQSQYSRQIKELEGFFGVALTRRVGRQIEITEEGQILAKMIRQHFRELNNFRDSMAGRATTLRIGSQGSIIEWLLIPRLNALRSSLGKVVLEIEQMRSRDTVRAVADGRLDLGIVREDAIPPEMKRWKLGQIGYAVFASKELWEGYKTPQELISKVPVAELLPGGQFAARWRNWLGENHLRPDVVARVSSFGDLVSLVRTGVAAVALPDIATVNFPAGTAICQPIRDLKPRPIALIANIRSLERMGFGQDLGVRLTELLHLPENTHRPTRKVHAS